MKMRKLFAGIAAAATLLGGMALGATSAQADDAAGTRVDSNVTFTFNAQDAKQFTERSLRAYKLADYVKYGSGEDYGVQTVTGVDRKVLSAALAAAGAHDVPNTGDLMAWALSKTNILSVDSADANGAWSNSASRKFVESLKRATNSLGEPEKVDLTVDSTDAKKATATLPAGIYLFVDADTKGTNKNATPSIAILVGSGTVGENGKLTMTGCATVDIKNQITTVTKKVNGHDSITASAGQKVTYTITSKVPQNTQYYDSYNYTYTDTPSSGQTVDYESFKVKVGEESLNKDTDYKVTPNDDGTFTIAITSIKRQTAGAEITITYDAIVTETEAAGNKIVTNKVVLSDQGAEAEDSTSITNGQFSFTKTDAQGEPLAGAQFEIQGAENGPATPKNNTATSDSNGNVTFKGLADGTYTVTETRVPTDFNNSLKASFTVVIKDGKATSFTGTDAWGLAPKTSTTGYKVKNVKSITQLPLTGAAGTMLFTVVALLVAGAGVTIAVKSRKHTVA